MKILYVDFGSSKTFGVRRKILSQVKSLRKLNVDIKLAIILEKKYDFISDISKEYFNFISIYYYNKQKKMYYNVKLILDIIAKLLEQEKPNILYMRYPGIRIIKPLKEKFKKIILITEHQSIEIKEKMMNKQWKSVIGEVLYGRNCRKYINGFVGVTDEVTKHEIKKANNNNRKYITISNGIDVSSLSLRVIPNFNKKSLNLLFIGNTSKYHGLDRLIVGLSQYKGCIDIVLHIIGPKTKEIVRLKKLIDKNSLNSKVIFHNPLSGINCDIMFNQCHISISGLAYHRIGMKEISPLKNQEYCARGIPFICAGDDLNFQSNFPYKLELTSNESPIDLEHVINFAVKVYTNKNHNFEMREYALRNIDWSIKMKKLKNFFKTVIENK